MNTYTMQVVMLVGIPGSGKSTWAKNYIETQLEPYELTSAVISRDDVRFAMLKDGEDYFAHENEVFEEFIRQINECIALGINYVFIDAIHINKASREKVLRRLVVDSRTSLMFVNCICPIELAIQRNAKREGLRRVPDSAIVNMAKRKSNPSLEDYPEDNYGFKIIYFMDTYPREGRK